MRALWGGLVLLLALSGCARVPQRGSSGGERQKITFAFWALEPAEVALTHELAGQFEHSHPGLEVKVLEIPGRYYDKLSTMFAAGTPPDVMVMNYGRLGDFTRRGLLADLQPMLPPHVRLSQFLPQAAKAFAEIGLQTGRAGLFALPVDWSPTNLLLYDPQALTAAGVAAPTGSWSWQQFEDACRKIAGVMRPEQRPASLCLYPYAATAWLLQGGGESWDADRRRSSLDVKENVSVVGLLRRWQRERLVLSPDPAQDRSLEDFESGRVAFAFVTPYSLTTLRKHRPLRAWALAPPLHDRRRVTGACRPAWLWQRARRTHRRLPPSLRSMPPKAPSDAQLRDGRFRLRWELCAALLWTRPSDQAQRECCVRPRAWRCLIPCPVRCRTSRLQERFATRSKRCS